MQLKKATAVKEVDLQSFIASNEDWLILHDINEPTSYVIEEAGTIISWFQIEPLTEDEVWLKKLFIVKNEALKLPAVLQTIIRFVAEKEAATIYVHSKQIVTDLLLSSFSFSLQSPEHLQAFQDMGEGNWWYAQIDQEH